MCLPVRKLTGYMHLLSWQDVKIKFEFELYYENRALENKM